MEANSFDLRHAFHEHYEMPKHMSINVTQHSDNHLHCAYPTHFSTHHTRIVFLPYVIHFVEYTKISTLAHPLQKPAQLPSLSLTLLTSSTSRSSSFTMTPTPPTSFSANSTNFNPQQPSTLSSSPHPLQATHISQPFLDYSQTSLFPLSLPIFHIPTPNISRASRRIASYACVLLYGRLELLFLR